MKNFEKLMYIYIFSMLHVFKIKLKIFFKQLKIMPLTEEIGDTTLIYVKKNIWNYKRLSINYYYL